MAYDVFLTADAEADLCELAEFLREREGSLRAEQTLQKLETAVQAIGVYPTKGQVPRELQALGITEFRQAVFKAWRVVYRIEAAKVYVLLIADGRRDMHSLLLRRLLGRT